MARLLIFGLGYTARHLATRLAADGWMIEGTTRTGEAGSLRFDDEGAIDAAIAGATHILVSIPPGQDFDPVLARYGTAIAAAPARWIGYLSSTGVYGDAGGAWVDESAAVGGGRRTARAAADLAWQSLRGDVRVFRLPAIYGPGRSAFERLRQGRAHRVNLPGQVFSRIHVEDIADAICASLSSGPPGAYNIADDLPAGQNAVIEYACALVGRAPPPLVAPGDPRLPPAAAAFYAENRRIANGKARRLLGWRPRFRDYRAGLLSILARSATTSPASASSPPIAASADQR